MRYLDVYWYLQITLSDKSREDLPCFKWCDIRDEGTIGTHACTHTCTHVITCTCICGSIRARVCKCSLRKECVFISGRTYEELVTAASFWERKLQGWDTEEAGRETSFSSRTLLSSALRACVTFGKKQVCSSIPSLYRFTYKSNK